PAIQTTAGPGPRLLGGGKPRDGAAAGGSLADVVRRSQEEKEKEGKPKKRSLGTITNENLKKGGGTAVATAKGSAPPAKPIGTPNPKETPRAEAALPKLPELRDDKGRTEADWKRLLIETSSRVTRAEQRVRDLENEARRLENEFFAFSDGN